MNKLMNELKNEINRTIYFEDLKEREIPSSTIAYYESLDPKIRDVLMDLETNHDNSWAVEIYKRNYKNLAKTALKYRGNEINYESMFLKAYQYAKSLKSLGFKKGDEIPVCVSNIPEFVYILLAINLIGCQANVVGEWFDRDYLLSILNKTGSKYIFASDDIYGKIKDVVDKSNVENAVMFSLEDSLPLNEEGKRFDPYDKFDKYFYRITNKVQSYQSKSSKSILNEKEFSNIGINYNGKTVEKCSIDDPFTITYTSGTTDPGRPKGCIHANKSYIVLSRFKESDVSGMPSMKNLTVLAHIPTYTHMELSCAISDTLYEGCTLAMEPFYSKDFFMNSLLINEPNFVPASVGFWGHVCKLLNYDKRFKNVKMPYLMLPTVTGEGLRPGEEDFLNYTARMHGFGRGKLPLSATFSIGGGTGESSGIFVLLYKHYQELFYHVKNDLGHNPHKFAKVEVINERGEFCQIGEPGLLVVDYYSPCNMKGYTDSTLDKDLIVTDCKGKKWLSLGTLATKSDSYGRIKMHGRPDSYIYSKEGKIPLYVIEEIILKDTKNIMSCSLVEVVENDDINYVCHIELQPTSKKNSSKVFEECALELKKFLPQDIIKSIYFRERTFDESFEVAPSGKRDKNSLIIEGLSDKCIPLSSYLDNNIKTKQKGHKKLAKTLE